MQYHEAHSELKEIPFINESNAKQLYNFIIDNNIRSILELGFAHGTATAYMAAAIDKLGNGHIDAVDLIEAQDRFQPSITTLLNKLGLNKYVSVHRMQTGYNWFLHDEIVNQTNPSSNVCQEKYDLIIIDGPKNWTIDSSSFFLADKLLKPTGWIIWDDFDWTYEHADTKRDVTDGIVHRTLSADERHVPHIREVFRLLVQQHPNYSNFRIHTEGDWAWAQKVKSDIKSTKHITSRSWSSMILFGLKKLLKY